MTATAALTGREVEAVRAAFAELRALASHAEHEVDQQQLRDHADRLIPNPVATRPLSEREIDVLAHIATGMQNGEVGLTLGLSAETVKSYLRSAFAKLGAHNRLEAVMRARQAGLLP